MLLAAMQAVPRSLNEAAWVDGANRWHTFRYITIPGIAPTILVVTMLGTIWTFGAIDLIYVMTYGGPTTTPPIFWPCLPTSGPLDSVNELCCRHRCGHFADRGLLHRDLSVHFIAVGTKSREKRMSESRATGSLANRLPAGAKATRASQASWLRTLFGLLGIYIPAALLILFVLSPFMWMLIGSFKTNAELMSNQGQTLWINHPTIENYIHLFRQYPFARFFLNSTIVSTFTTLIAISFAAFAGYSLNCFRFPGRMVVGVLILMTQMIPGIALLIPLYVLFNKLHLLDSYQGLISRTTPLPSRFALG